MSEIKEAVEQLDKKMADYKDEVKGIAVAAEKKAAEVTAEVNEKMAKQGASLKEIQDKLIEVEKAAGRIAAKQENEIVEDFKSMVIKGIKENFDAIQGIKKGSNGVSFETKTVGTMTIADNLTGSGVARYSLDPALRGRRKVHYRDLVDVIPTDTGTWKYYRQNDPVGEGSFGTQTIGSGKAQIDYDLTEKTVTVDTVAGYVRVAKQMLRDLPFLQGFLPSELQEDYMRAETNKFINAHMAETAAYSTSASVYAEKLIEWIGVLMGRDYNPNGIVTTSANWSTMLSTKPSDYSIPGGVTITANGEVAIAGVPVMVCTGMTGTKTFVGDWSRAKIIQANALSINFYEQDSDNVQKNLVTVRAEADVQLAVLRPDAFLYV